MPFLTSALSSYHIHPFILVLCPSSERLSQQMTSHPTSSEYSSQPLHGRPGAEGEQSGLTAAGVPPAGDYAPFTHDAMQQQHVEPTKDNPLAVGPTPEASQSIHSLLTLELMTQLHAGRSCYCCARRSAYQPPYNQGQGYWRR